MKGLGAYLHRPAMATEKRATLRQRLQAQLTLPDQVEKVMRRVLFPSFPVCHLASDDTTPSKH
jgi:hypothetical protein